MVYMSCQRKFESKCDLVRCTDCIFLCILSATEELEDRELTRIDLHEGMMYL